MTAGQENVDHGRELKGHTAACLTGMILCITPPDKMAVQCSTTFYIQATSAELNELNTMSSLNDYAEPAGEKQVWDIHEGNASGRDEKADIGFIVLAVMSENLVVSRTPKGLLATDYTLTTTPRRKKADKLVNGRAV